MLSDRPYMRGPEFRGWSALSMTVTLLIAHLAVFILQEVNRAYGLLSAPTFYGLFALSKAGLAHGYVWQLLTFQFLHAGLWHFLLNMLGLYLFGRAVEEAIGRRHFLVLYVTSGVVGGLLQALLCLLDPRVRDIWLLGASAGVFGLVAAFATLQPEREILLFFIIPIRAKYFLWIGGAVSVFYILVPAERGIAHGAHLGGMLAGLAYVNAIIRSEVTFSFWRPLRVRREPEELVGVHRPGERGWRRPRKVELSENRSGDFISREVDPILDKISAHGIQSLTPRERKILESARDQMERR